MGKHNFTINLRAEFEGASIQDGESARTITLPAHVLANLTASLRNEVFELETMTGEEFQEVLPLATSVNNVLLEIENLIGNEEEDDDDDE